MTDLTQIRYLIIIEIEHEYQMIKHVIPISNSEYSKLIEFVVAFIVRLPQAMRYSESMEYQTQKITNNKDSINTVEQLFWPQVRN